MREIKSDDVYRIRIHPIVFLPVLLMGIVSAFCFSLKAFWFSVVMIFLTGVTLLKAIARFLGDTYLLTSNKLVIERNFFNHVSREIYFSRIEGLDIWQSLLGKLNNYGTIIVIGVGGTRTELSYVPDPWKFKKIFEQILEKKIEI